MIITIRFFNCFRYTEKHLSFFTFVSSKFPAFDSIQIVLHKQPNLFLYYMHNYKLFIHIEIYVLIHSQHRLNNSKCYRRWTVTASLMMQHCVDFSSILELQLTETSETKIIFMDDFILLEKSLYIPHQVYETLESSCHPSI